MLSSVRSAPALAHQADLPRDLSVPIRQMGGEIKCGRGMEKWGWHQRGWLGNVMRAGQGHGRFGE